MILIWTRYSSKLDKGWRFENEGYFIYIIDTEYVLELAGSSLPFLKSKCYACELSTFSFEEGDLDRMIVYPQCKRLLDNFVLKYLRPVIKHLLHHTQSFGKRSEKYESHNYFMKRVVSRQLVRWSTAEPTDRRVTRWYAGSSRVIDL